MPHGGEGHHRKSPDLAEPPKAADVDCNNALCRYSIIWPPYFNVWSTLTLSRPCQGSQAPGPWTGNDPLHYHTYRCQFQVTVTKSLMSHIMYAAPVTSNVICWDAHHSHLEEGSFCIVWSCSAQSRSCSRFKLFVLSGRIKAITQGGEERIKIYYVWSCAELCGAVRLRAVRIVSHELFLHSERIRTVTLGVCIHIFVSHSCAILLLLKYIIDEKVSCSQNNKMYA